MSLSGCSVLIILCRASPLDPFLKAARWIGRSQSPFTNFHAVFDAAQQSDKEDDGNGGNGDDGGDDGDDDDDDDGAQAKQTGRYCVFSYRAD